MATKHTNIILSIILLLALVIRGWHLSSVPALNPDEASLGYNAFSIINTLKDEHGSLLPIHFKSFGDFKPGGYVYLSIPFIKIFGLNPLAVRLPNLIFSILAIYIFSKLILLLSANQTLALISAVFLSISPWHIHFSRGAWESNVALTLILVANYYFLLFVRQSKNRYLYYSLALFSTSLYFYHSARILAPTLLLFLLISNYKKLADHKITVFTAIALFLLIAGPVTISFITNGGSSRFSGVGLLADPGPLSRSEELLNHHSSTLLGYRTIHNRRLLYLLSWSEKYLSHFSPNFLFVTGDEVPRSKSPEVGQLNLIDFPLIIVGAYIIFSTSSSLVIKNFYLSWFILAPLASSLTFQSPSALRSLPLVIPFIGLSSTGFYYIATTVRRKIPGLFEIISIIAIAAIVYFHIYYLDAYFIHSPKRYPFAWNTSADKIVSVINQNKDKYNQVYLTTKYDQPYILYLFYSHYPPAQIQSQIKLTPKDQFGFSTVSKIDNIYFEKINWSNIPANSLVIAADEPVPQGPAKVLNFPNGSPGYNIYIK